MIKFLRIYDIGKYKINRRTHNRSFILRRGYGYIKRRVGLLSIELESPAHVEILKKD
jgi:hypothetical protein